ncbi:hypothetical protein [Streptomyces sp. XD-27]|uniref:hypothetical protein n=1 Tax=Streptomyces sp. XD-27 TaxID=3062779 RepID=UPI0026F413BF|nr:hypothetical protein [Streptomyces sp. XD-27]WKX70032.1 hypothetical protein Q3Y56_09010 [Streptomyces sp. XD-27]
MTTPAHMSSRRDRRATREAERNARRERIRILLARADRGVLTAEDAAQLRGDVEAEVTECDTHRRSAGGQQAAAMRLHRRVEAAEQAIVELEAERDSVARDAAGALAAPGRDGTARPAFDNEDQAAA